MATPTHGEYLSIDGVPLSTPAWTTEDISDLLSGPSARGSDLLKPARIGETPRRRTLASRSAAIPVIVNGYVDSDGDAYTDPRAGLIANLDELKALLTPNFSSLTGTRTLTWTNTESGVTREAQVHLNPAVGVAAIGPYAARVVIEMTIPGGVLRDADTTELVISLTGAQTTKTQTITVPGNVEVQDALIDVDGAAGNPDAASFKISNLTYDAGGGVYLLYDEGFEDPLSIDCGNYTATDNGGEISGLIVSAGSPIWLPLLPGANSIRIDLVGNAVATDVTITVRGAWA